MTDKVNEHNAKELGTDYWEVEWHLGARNTGTGYMNHQSWQGKVYSSAEMRTVCGLGEMLGFAGINCYHIRFPFIPGISKRKYTDEWLAEQNRKENEKKSFHGKEYRYIRGVAVSAETRAYDPKAETGYQAPEKGEPIKMTDCSQMQEALNGKDLCGIFEGYGFAAAERAIEGWKR